MGALLVTQHSLRTAALRCITLETCKDLVGAKGCEPARNACVGDQQTISVGAHHDVLRRVCISITAV